MSRERLWTWVQGEDDEAASRAEIAAHVEVCLSCKSELAEMRDILGDLAAVGAAPVAAAAGPKLPEFIGDYRILKRIGHGGMGVVYEAEQADPRRKVALKVILGGQHVSELQVKFFQREVQTLARMSHPTIAAIHEAGRTDDGNHFFAMELVHGVSLKDYAAGRRAEDKSGATADVESLSLRDRLILFRRVCEGISYAHQRGVIHRDIKPSNILVVDEPSSGNRARRSPFSVFASTAAANVGQPKILDFGLARMMEDDAAVPSIHTESGRLMGTLPYMSPEQAEGQPDRIDVRSDVYALGVVLYELMTGSLPYDVSSASLLASVKVICEQRPVGPQAVNREIPGEVATIVLKALEKEPERRYQSVAAFADDIDRFLSGQPILARPPSTIYQLRKLVARHRVPSALAALLLLSILGGGIGMMVHANRIAEEARKSQRLSAVISTLYESADPWKTGRTDITVLETLDLKSRELISELEDDPLVGAAVRNTIGNLYKGMSRLSSAEAHLIFALETRRRLLGDLHADTAESMNDLGELRYEQARLDEAEKLWRAALLVRRDQLGPASAEAAETLNNLGNLLRHKGEFDEAELSLDEAIRIRRRLYAEAQTDPHATAKHRKQARNDVAQSLNNLAGLLRSRKTPEALALAERHYREALRIREESLGAQHPEVGKMYNNLGKLLQDRGDYAGAEQAFQSSLQILRGEQGLGQNHQFVARLLHSYAEVKLARNDPVAARALCEEALEMRRNLLGESHPETVESQKLLKSIGGAVVHNRR